jgi:hypothetical protein
MIDIAFEFLSVNHVDLHHYISYHLVFITCTALVWQPGYRQIFLVKSLMCKTRLQVYDKLGYFT